MQRAGRSTGEAARALPRSNPDQLRYLFCERTLVALEARHHGSQKRVGIEPPKLKRMPSLRSNERHEGKLRPAVAITKGMNCIDLREEVRRC